MGYIKIPKIKVELPIFHGTAAETLERGAGHLVSSALAVLTGHTGLNTAKLFMDLIELTAGDEFYIHTLNQVLAYRVDQIIVVEPKDVEALLPVSGKDYVTLSPAPLMGSTATGCWCGESARSIPRKK